MEYSEILLRLRDDQWQETYTDHDRQIVRAVVFDDNGVFYFNRVDRDDIFGKARCIETAGGGVEPGEDLLTAVRRELNEELGVTVEILCRLGVVEDHYNLIHRRNFNHYYLCRALRFGEKHLTKDERERFHLSTLKLSFADAVREYERCADGKLGKLIANRELPILNHAGTILKAENWLPNIP